MSKKERWGTIALVGLVVAIHIWSLMRFPYPFVDEAWNGSRAWAFVRTNRQFGPLDAGVFDRYDGYWTVFPWLPTAVQSLAPRLVPEPDLFPLRCISLLLGFMLLAAIYGIATPLYDRRVGLLSLVLVAFSWPFLYSAHLARSDILAAALGFVAIALYLNNPTHRFLPGLLSGLCLGGAFETHAHAAIFVPALGALYLFDLRWATLRKASFWGVVLGGLIGVAFYLALHILPYPEEYAAIYDLAYSITHVPPILTLDLKVLAQSAYDLATTLAVTHQAMLIVPIVGSVFLLKRRSTPDQRLLVLSASLLLGAWLLIRNKQAYYVILFSPVLELLVAAFLPSLLGRPWQRRVLTYLGYALVLGCAVGTLLANLLVLRNNFQRPYAIAQANVNRSILPDDTIMAAQTYWFGLYENTYYSWEHLIYFQRYAPGSSLEEAFREFQPTVLIIDGHLRNFISDNPGKSMYAQHLNLPETEMNAFLTRYAELVDEFEIFPYGLIQVYRLHWEREQACGQEDRTAPSPEPFLPDGMLTSRSSPGAPEPAATADEARPGH